MKYIEYIKETLEEWTKNQEQQSKAVNRWIDYTILFLFSFATGMTCAILIILSE